MVIILTKVSKERHRFTIERETGAKEQAELETRSFLKHDLLHFAVERQAGVHDGFYGSLVAGKSLADMNGPQAMANMKSDMHSGLPLIERLVGALSALIANPPASEAEIWSRIQEYGAQLNQVVPSWLTLAYIQTVKADAQNLLRQWESLRIGGELRLVWPEDSAKK